MSDNEDPKQVTDLLRAINTIAGIHEVAIDRTYLPNVEPEDLKLAGPYADLPIAVLRRSGGGLENELLLSINFKITRDEAGLKALEFMSWWVRDQSRGGENMQIRSMALPPMMGDDVQLGESLWFTIDWFYVSASQDVQQLLNDIGEAAKFLELCKNMYRAAF